MTTTTSEPKIGDRLPAASPWRGKRSVLLLEAAPGDPRAVELARTLADIAADLEYWRATAVLSGAELPDLPIQHLSVAAPARSRLTVTDRYGEIVAIYEDGFPAAKELVDWAKFLEISCGACSTPS